jgi:hypothetical protein
VTVHSELKAPEMHYEVMDACITFTVRLFCYGIKASLAVDMFIMTRHDWFNISLLLLL